MKKNSFKAWLYLLPALIFLGVFMLYPLIDVLIYSVEEGYNSASQTSFGIGSYNFSYVLHDPYFMQALQNCNVNPFTAINNESMVNQKNGTGYITCITDTYLRGTNLPHHETTAQQPYNRWTSDNTTDRFSPLSDSAH